MMKILKRILEERQKPNLVFKYDDIKEFISQKIFDIQANWMTVIFDLESYIQEKERKKLREATDFKKLPLGQQPILIDEIKMKLLEDLKSKRKRGGLSSMAEEKIVQEITFVDNFFHTHKGKEISQLYPNLNAKKKIKQLNKKKNADEKENEEVDMGMGMGSIAEHQSQHEENKYYDENNNKLSQEEIDEKQMKMVNNMYLNLT